MTACDFKPKSQSTDYPRPCTEEDVSVSVRDKYFNQVENFLSNFYLLSLEVVDRDMAEDFVANLFHDAGKKNFLPEFMHSDNKSEYFSPTQYLMEYDKMLQPFNRDELVLKVDNFSHEKDMYMLSMRSCYTVSDYDLTLLRDDKIIFKSRCRAWCCFPKASSYLTVKLMQVEPAINVVCLDNTAVLLSAQTTVESADTITAFSDTLPVKDNISITESNVSVSVEEQKIIEPVNIINGHEYVDLGLSVKWATCNIGAESPEKPGYYFAWGETTPKDKYTKNDYLYIKSVKSNISKSFKYDAAQFAWGEGWRLPTKKELQELTNKCIWEKEVIKGAVGFRITGPNGNSIFLPAAGIKNIKTESYNYSGCYWGGDSNYVGIKDGYKAIQLNFTYAGHKSIDWCTRYFGRCIRAVAD